MRRCDKTLQVAPCRPVLGGPPARFLMLTSCLPLASGLLSRSPFPLTSLCQLPDLAHFDVPSIHVELGPALRLSPLEHKLRPSVTEKRDSEEDSESTAL